MKKKSPTLAWRHSTSSTKRELAFTGRTHGWHGAAGALVGSVCIITTDRRCLATRWIRRRLGRSARRTNINLTARASHNDLQLLFIKGQQRARWAFKRGFQVKNIWGKAQQSLAA